MTQERQARPKPYKQAIGRWGELQAAAYLEKEGFILQERNIRTPEGEIDLAMAKDGEIHFIEVKTRTTLRYGFPEEAINLNKYAHMVSAAELYLNQHPEYLDHWHIDVIAIIGRPDSANLEIKWIQDVTL